MDELTPAGRIIAEEIERTGPIPFSRFMDVALYHPQHGYYRRLRDPFGREGDFYTAEQLQPVFGRLLCSTVRELAAELGRPEEVPIIELGAGRREMAEAFSGYRYMAVDIDYGELPERFSGIVFSNEFFDAVPVDLAISRDGIWCERRVSFTNQRFDWDDSVPANVAGVDDVSVLEIQDKRIRWIEQIGRILDRGYVFTIDYGYTRSELRRFPEGSLMSYRRHQAIDDVLARPGEQDITAHVDFSALQEHGRSAGLETVRYESLANTLLRAGEGDQFASALEGATEPEQFRHRMQLKTLLFGMGETFRVLLQRK